MASLLMVTRKNPIHSALWMIVTFFAMAVIYLLLNAQFIAVAQVMVYAGAIMMLILFVIMLVHMERGGEVDSGKSHRSVKTKIAWALITVVLLAEVLLGALFYRMTGVRAASIRSKWSTASAMSRPWALCSIASTFSLSRSPRFCSSSASWAPS